MPLVVKLPGLPIPASWRRRGTALFRRASNLWPPTWTGTLVGVFSALALWRWGYGQMDLLLFVFGLSGLVLLGLAMLFTVGSSLYLRRELKARPDLAAAAAPRLETGSPTETGFHLPALGGLPLVKVRWTFAAPEGLECRPRPRHGRLVEEVVARRRFGAQGAERHIETRDAFGLTRLAFRCPSPGPWTALPNPGRLGAMPRISSVASAEGLPHPSGAPEGDRMEIRRYVPGDPVRHILWKVYARTGRVNVRVPERAVDRSPRMVAYLLTGPRDEAAAAAARVALENELLGSEWLFAADGFPEPTDDLQKALTYIAGSGSSAGRGGAGELARFLARPEAVRETHCVVFAPAEPGPWVAEALDVGRSFSGVLSFVLGTDGVASSGPKPRWQRLLFFDPDESPDAGPRIDSRRLSRLMATFTAAGNPVMVVDRTSGRSHGHIDSRAVTAGAAGAPVDTWGKTG